MVRLAGIRAIQDAEVVVDADEGAAGDVGETLEKQEARLVAAYQEALQLAARGDKSQAIATLEHLLLDPLFEPCPTHAYQDGAPGTTLQSTPAVSAALATQGPTVLKASLSQLYVGLLRNLAGLLPPGREADAAQLYCLAVLQQGDQADDAVLWGRLGQCAAKSGDLGLARFAMEQGIHIANGHLPLYEHAMEVAWEVGDYQGAVDVAQCVLRVDSHHPGAQAVQHVQLQAHTQQLVQQLLGSSLPPHQLRQLDLQPLQLALLSGQLQSKEQEPLFPPVPEQFPTQHRLLLPKPPPGLLLEGPADQGAGMEGLEAQPVQLPAASQPQLPVLVLPAGKTLEELLYCLLQALLGGDQSHGSADGHMPSHLLGQLVVVCMQQQRMAAAQPNAMQPGATRQSGAHTPHSGGSSGGSHSSREEAHKPASLGGAVAASQPLPASAAAAATGQLQPIAPPIPGSCSQQQDPAGQGRPARPSGSQAMVRLVQPSEVDAHAAAGNGSAVPGALAHESSDKENQGAEGVQVGASGSRVLVKQTDKQQKPGPGAGSAAAAMGLRSPAAARLQGKRKLAPDAATGRAAVAQGDGEAGRSVRSRTAAAPAAAATRTAAAGTADVDAGDEQIGTRGVTGVRLQGSVAVFNDLKALIPPMPAGAPLAPTAVPLASTAALSAPAAAQVAFASHSNDGPSSSQCMPTPQLPQQSTTDGLMQQGSSRQLLQTVPGVVWVDGPLPATPEVCLTWPNSSVLSQRSPDQDTAPVQPVMLPELCAAVLEQLLPHLQQVPASCVPPLLALHALLGRRLELPLEQQLQLAQMHIVQAESLHAAAAAAAATQQGPSAMKAVAEVTATPAAAGRGSGGPGSRGGRGRSGPAGAGRGRSGPAAAADKAQPARRSAGAAGPPSQPSSAKPEISARRMAAWKAAVQHVAAWSVEEHLRAADRLAAQVQGTLVLQGAWQDLVLLGGHAAAAPGGSGQPAAGPDRHARAPPTPNLPAEQTDVEMAEVTTPHSTDQDAAAGTAGMPSLDVADGSTSAPGLHTLLGLYWVWAHTAELHGHVPDALRLYRACDTILAFLPGNPPPPPPHGLPACTAAAVSSKLRSLQLLQLLADAEAGLKPAEGEVAAAAPAAAATACLASAAFPQLLSLAFPEATALLLLTPGNHIAAAAGGNGQQQQQHNHSALDSTGPTGIPHSGGARTAPAPPAVPPSGGPAESSEVLLPAAPPSGDPVALQKRALRVLQACCAAAGTAAPAPVRRLHVACAVVQATATVAAATVGAPDCPAHGHQSVAALPHLLAVAEDLIASLHALLTEHAGLVWPTAPTNITTSTTTGGGLLHTPARTPGLTHQPVLSPLAARQGPAAATTAQSVSREEALLSHLLVRLQHQLLDYLQVLHSASPAAPAPDGPGPSRPAQAALTARSHAALLAATQLLELLQLGAWQAQLAGGAMVQAQAQGMAVSTGSTGSMQWEGVAGGGEACSLPAALQQQPAQLVMWSRLLEVLGSRLAAAEVQSTLRHSYRSLVSMMQRLGEVVGGPDKAAAILFKKADATGGTGGDSSDKDEAGSDTDERGAAVAGTPAPADLPGARDGDGSEAGARGSITPSAAGPSAGAGTWAGAAAEPMAGEEAVGLSPAMPVGRGGASQGAGAGAGDVSPALAAHVRAVYGAVAQVFLLLTGVRLDWRDATFGNVYGTHRPVPTTAVPEITSQEQVLQLWELMAPLAHVLSGKQASKLRSLLDRMQRHAPPVPPAALLASPAVRYLDDKSLSDHSLALGHMQPPQVLCSAPTPNLNPDGAMMVTPGKAAPAVGSGGQAAGPAAAAAAGVGAGSTPGGAQGDAGTGAGRLQAGSPVSAMGPNLLVMAGAVRTSRGPSLDGTGLPPVVTAASGAAGRNVPPAVTVASGAAGRSVPLTGAALGAAARAAGLAAAAAATNAANVTARGVAQGTPPRNAGPAAGVAGPAAVVAGLAAGAAGPAAGAAGLVVSAAVEQAAVAAPPAVAPQAAAGAGAMEVDVPQPALDQQLTLDLAPQTLDQQQAVAALEPTLDEAEASLHRDLHFLVAEAIDPLSIMTDPVEDAGHAKVEKAAELLLSDLLYCPSRLATWHRLAELYGTACSYVLNHAARDMTPAAWQSPARAPLRARYAFYLRRAIRSFAVCLAAVGPKANQRGLWYEALGMLYLNHVQGCTPLADALPPCRKLTRDVPWVQDCCTTYLVYEQAFTCINQEWTFPFVMGKLPHKLQDAWPAALAAVRAGRPPTIGSTAATAAAGAATLAVAATAAHAAAASMQGGAGMVVAGAGPVQTDTGAAMDVDVPTGMQGQHAGAGGTAWVDEMLRCYAQACQLCLSTHGAAFMDPWYRLHAARLKLVLDCRQLLLLPGQQQQPGQQQAQLGQPQPLLQGQAAAGGAASLGPAAVAQQRQRALAILRQVSRFCFSAATAGQLEPFQHLLPDSCLGSANAAAATNPVSVSDAAPVSNDAAPVSDVSPEQAQALLGVLLEDCCEAMRWCAAGFKTSASGGGQFHRAHYQVAKVFCHMGQYDQVLEELKAVVGPSTSKRGAIKPFDILAQLVPKQLFKAGAARSKKTRKGEQRDQGALDLFTAPRQPLSVMGIGEAEDGRDFSAAVRRLVKLFLTAAAAVGDVERLEQAAAFLATDKNWSEPLADLAPVARGLWLACLSERLPGLVSKLKAGGDSARPAAAGATAAAGAALAAAAGATAAAGAAEAAAAGAAEASGPAAAQAGGTAAGGTGGVAAVGAVGPVAPTQADAPLLQGALSLFLEHVVDRLPQPHTLQAVREAAGAPGVVALLQGVAGRGGGLGAPGGGDGGAQVTEEDLAVCVVAHIKALGSAGALESLQVLARQLRTKRALKPSATQRQTLPPSVQLVLGTLAAALVSATCTAVASGVDQLVSAQQQHLSALHQHQQAVAEQQQQQLAAAEQRQQQEAAEQQQLLLQQQQEEEALAEQQQQQTDIDMSAAAEPNVAAEPAAVAAVQGGSSLLREAAAAGEAAGAGPLVLEPPAEAAAPGDMQGVEGAAAAADVGGQPQPAGPAAPAAPVPAGVGRSMRSAAGQALGSNRQQQQPEAAAGTQAGAAAAAAGSLPQQAQLQPPASPDLQALLKAVLQPLAACLQLQPWQLCGGAAGSQGSQQLPQAQLESDLLLAWFNLRRSVVSQDPDITSGDSGSGSGSGSSSGSGSGGAAAWAALQAVLHSDGSKASKAAELASLCDSLPARLAAALATPPGPPFPVYPPLSSTPEPPQQMAGEAQLLLSLSQQQQQQPQQRTSPTSPSFLAEKQKQRQQQLLRRQQQQQQGPHQPMHSPLAGLGALLQQVGPVNQLNLPNPQAGGPNARVVSTLSPGVSAALQQRLALEAANQVRVGQAPMMQPQQHQQQHSPEHAIRLRELLEAAGYAPPGQQGQQGGQAGQQGQRADLVAGQAGQQGQQGQQVGQAAAAAFMRHLAASGNALPGLQQAVLMGQLAASGNALPGLQQAALMGQLAASGNALPRLQQAGQPGATTAADLQRLVFAAQLQQAQQVFLQQQQQPGQQQQQQQLQAQQQQQLHALRVQQMQEQLRAQDLQQQGKQVLPKALQQLPPEQLKLVLQLQATPQQQLQLLQRLQPPHQPQAQQQAQALQQAQLLQQLQPQQLILLYELHHVVQSTSSAPQAAGPSQPANSPALPSNPQGPSYQAPSSQGPSNQGPSNQAPSQGPSNQGPRNQAPSTQGPSNQGLSSQGPSNQAPSTQGPSTQGPSNQGPSNQGPSNVGLAAAPATLPGSGAPGLSEPSLAPQGPTSGRPTTTPLTDAESIRNSHTVEIPACFQGSSPIRHTMAPPVSQGGRGSRAGPAGTAPAGAAGGKAPAGRGSGAAAGRGTGAASGRAKKAAGSGPAALANGAGVQKPAARAKRAAAAVPVPGGGDRPSQPYSSQGTGRKEGRLHAEGNGQPAAGGSNGNGPPAPAARRAYIDVQDRDGWPGVVPAAAVQQPLPGGSQGNGSPAPAANGSGAVQPAAPRQLPFPVFGARPPVITTPPGQGPMP